MMQFIKSYLTEILTKNQCIQTDNLEHTNEIINGSYRVKGIAITKELTINGEAIFEDEVIVQEKIIINGALRSKDVNFKSDLISNGTISLINSTIKGHFFLNGVLKAQNSVFMNSVNLLTGETSFDQCQIDSMILQKLTNKKIVQKIWLKNKTKVMGDIVFQSGRGEVYVDATSVIQGRIIGGDLIQEVN